MRGTVHAYIGLGSNLDEPLQQVRSAFAALDAIEQTRLVARSPLYRSAPLGPSGQPDYINAVAGVDTQLDPDALLGALQAIENDHGRVRRERWGPRTLDLDLLLYGDVQRDDALLTIPHPRLHERAFVLYPLADIAPADLPIPGKPSLASLLNTCPALAIEKITEITEITE